MIHSVRLLLLLAVLSVSCAHDAIGPDRSTGATGITTTIAADPCEGVELPPCPPPCEAGAFEKCGTPCAVEGESCGSEIGDGMRCTGGQWQCVVHPPLGTGCNLVCRAG